MRSHTHATACLLLLALAGCAASARAAPFPATNHPQYAVATQTVGQPPPPLPLRIPISGVMIGVIDLSAQTVFDTASETTLTDAEWSRAGLAAINLIGASSLITLPGTGKSDADWVADPDWRMRATAMQKASLEAAIASRDRKQADLIQATQRLTAACQSCHDRFQPGAPLTSPTRMAALDQRLLGD